MGSKIAVSAARQGEFNYFTGSMPVGELAHLVVFPDELGDLDEDERMQRGLMRSRVQPLIDYLTQVPDHFFSAVTLIILPRELDRPAIEHDPSEDDDDGVWDYYFETSE